jgi:Fe-Mn family superoxide dismutase
MSPSGGGKPAGPLAEAINARFGDLAGFNREFSRSALARFGSGWTWLVQAPEGLDIVNTGNADTPITSGVEPLLTLDVWEHAYYLDHQNRRADYIEAFLVSLINWDFAAQNYAAQPVAA